jgi:hypothetical protein
MYRDIFGNVPKIGDIIIISNNRTTSLDCCVIESFGKNTINLHTKGINGKNIIFKGLNCLTFKWFGQQLRGRDYLIIGNIDTDKQHIKTI